MENSCSRETILFQVDIKQRNSENTLPWLMFQQQRQEVGEWEKMDYVLL